jgi:hypothetical protein
MEYKSIFFKPRNQNLANKISIKSPLAFRSSIKELRKGGINMPERRGLILAQNRSKLMLMRHNLSPMERKQFNTISKIKLPKVSRR